MSLYCLMRRERLRTVWHEAHGVIPASPTLDCAPSPPRRQKMAPGREPIGKADSKEKRMVMMVMMMMMMMTFDDDAGDDDADDEGEDED